MAKMDLVKDIFIKGRPRSGGGCRFGIVDIPQIRADASTFGSMTYRHNGGTAAISIMPAYPVGS